MKEIAGHCYCLYRTRHSCSRRELTFCSDRGYCCSQIHQLYHRKILSCYPWADKMLRPIVECASAMVPEWKISVTPVALMLRPLLIQAWIESPASVERYVWFTDKGYSKRTLFNVWLAPKAMIVDLPAVCWLVDWLLPCWLTRPKLEYVRFGLHWNSDDLIERVLSPWTEYAGESFTPLWFLTRLPMALNCGLGIST